MYMRFFFFFSFFIKAYVMGTHLKFINMSMQFKWVPTTYAFIKQQPNTILAEIWRLQNCLTVLIGVHAVIRSYVFGIHRNCLTKALPTSTYNIHFQMKNKNQNFVVGKKKQKKKQTRSYLEFFGDILSEMSHLICSFVISFFRTEVKIKSQGPIIQN